MYSSRFRRGARFVAVAGVLSVCAVSGMAQLESAPSSATKTTPVHQVTTFPKLVEMSPVSDRILMLTLVDGQAFHETRGNGGADGRVISTPLNLEKAAQPVSYAITSVDDAAYKASLHPQKVGRKSKGQDFVNNQQKFQWVTNHSLYLVLPHAMQRGKTYSVSVDDLASGMRQISCTFDERKTRSETVHVNHLGYVPSAPQKFAYISAWMGDLGPLSLNEYSDVQFHIVERKSGKIVFSGKPTLRQQLTQADGGQPDEGPSNNYTGAPLWQLDFSGFATPGNYIISVDRIGSSFPFTIGEDVYRQAFITTARALYHQRCGIELKEPYTKWTRPACHDSAQRAFLQTSHRYMDKAYSDGPRNAVVPLTGEKRTDVWGGWHDAGDWDREGWHPEVANTLLLTYELSPQKFRDGELNIPESGNGLPDIVDEARWGVDFYKRIQRPDGGISVGFFESSWPQGGETSDTDSLIWYMYAEEPLASYRYAAIACRLAWCLKIAGKEAVGTPYIESAKRAWQWAGKNMREGDEAKVRDDRFHAAAALYKATGEAQYQDAFKQDLLIDQPKTLLSEWSKRDQRWGAWTYATTDWPNIDRVLKERLVAAALHYAQVDFVETAQKRGARYAYNWYLPMWYGAATTPKTLPLAVAHHLSRDAKFVAPQYTTCDFMLGGNPLNMVWVTGLGHKHPREVFHPDSWYDNIAEVVPGIVPLGPHRLIVETATGPWSPAFAQATAYPQVRTWPPHELWFENRFCPPTNEFTIGSIAEAVAAYGSLCADLPPAKR
ncbi:MAG TPA: glycoside hydrolase family 9 protein [Abditibacteriaceae bacterium]|jgi:hypothetical protein